MKSRVESLEKEKQNIDVAVERIKAEIQSLELEEKKKNLVSLIQDSVSVTVKTTKAYTIFYLGDSFSRKNGLEIGINEEVTIFPYLSHKTVGNRAFYKGIYDSQLGWLLESFFDIADITGDAISLEDQNSIKNKNTRPNNCIDFVELLSAEEVAIEMGKTASWVLANWKINLWEKF